MVNAGQEPAPLLVLRDMQEELQDLRPVSIEMALKGVDVLVPLLPKLFAPGRVSRHLLALEDLGVDAHDEDIFVIRPIEYPDSSALGDGLGTPPQERMVQLLR